MRHAPLHAVTWCDTPFHTVTHFFLSLHACSSVRSHKACTTSLPRGKYSAPRATPPLHTVTHCYKQLHTVTHRYFPRGRYSAPRATTPAGTNHSGSRVRRAAQHTACTVPHRYAPLRTVTHRYARLHTATHRCAPLLPVPAALLRADNGIVHTVTRAKSVFDTPQARAAAPRAGRDRRAAPRAPSRRLKRRYESPTHRATWAHHATWTPYATWTARATWLLPL